MTWILFIVCIAFLPAPYVTPFANAGPMSSSSSSSHTLAQQQQQSLLLNLPPTASTFTSGSKISNTVLLLSNTVSSVSHNDNEQQKRNLSSSNMTIWHKLRHPATLLGLRRTSMTTTTTITTTSISTATTKNSFLSRLFFNYVVPLLHLSSLRQLTVEDALLFQNNNQYNNTITPSVSFSEPDRTVSNHTRLTMTREESNYHKLHHLQQIYDQLTEQEYQQQHMALAQTTTTTAMTTTLHAPTPPVATGTKKVRLPKSSTLLLAQALLQHQRPYLIVTGLLRLTNTIVQAFPSILVAKLLRSIEAGTTQPIHTSLLTATTLVTILSIKMILENQYFHYLVQSSTNIRDNLASMIFNKSLRLQQGGSNTVRKDSFTSIPTVQSEDKALLNRTTTVDGGMNEDVKSGTSSATPSTPTSTTLGVGGVINLMQSDTSIIESAAMQFHTIWDGPLQIAIYTTLLFRYLGPSVLYGMAVLLLTIPVNSIALRILNRLSRYENEAKDARTKRTTESISHMKLLKLQNWEQQFAADIRFHRQKELQHFVSRGFIRAANSAISNAIPAVVLVVTLTAYVRTGRPIVASTIFTAISLFNQLRFPLFFYPLLIDSIANGRNAMRRIAAFLSATEVVPYVQYVTDGQAGGSIEMKNGNFLWSMSQQSSTTPERHDTDKLPLSEDAFAAPALSNVNIKINPGEVVAVIGSVGSGKSALIKGLLGELNPIVPEPSNTYVNYPLVISHGNIAYCSQEAWLPKGTLREAITFGREYDEERYTKAIFDAGLNDDIAPTSYTDSTSANGISASNGGALRHDTDVGEGGSSLSGGQRARVSLARALYSGDDTKVFLLDDCLAALDTRVGSTVFDRMTGRLRKSKAATLLVTNDPSIPRRCDRVILMGSVPGSTSSSTILDVGTYDELLSRGHDLRGITASDDIIEDANIDISYTSAFNDTSSHVASALPVPSVTHGVSEPNIIEPVDCSYGDCETQLTMQNCPDSIADQVGTKRRSSNDDDYVVIDHVCFAKDAGPTFNDTDFDKSQLAEMVSGIVSPSTPQQHDVQAKSKTITSVDDSMSMGAVPRSIYMLYLKSVGSPILVVAMFASYLLSNGAQFYQQYTVAKWTEVGANAMGSVVGLGYLQRLVYAAGVVSVFLWIRSVLTMQVGVRASSFLHSKMLSSVFAAPMSFFDVTPSGQLLSRFGKEIETVDKGVPDSIGSVLFCFLQIFLSAGALAGILSSGMAIPLALVAVLYIRMMSRFRPAARDMKRVETKTRSPIYTNFGEAIRGAETIRSIQGSSTYWANRHQSLFNTNIRVYYTVKALDRWLSTRLETLGNVVVFASAVASVILTRSGQLKAGSAGWGLTQALSVTGLLTWAVRCLTDLESNMMSVMRVKELTDLESESVDLSVMTDSTRKPSMPKELIHPGDALVPLLSEANREINATLAPLQSEALVKSGWPWLGNVEFRNVSMRYTPDSPLVLKDLSLSVPAGTTLGIVGRSGSGKSSLLLTLFRLAEIENGIGSIQIDGVDVRSVGISTLRQSLAIIPQDPFLFTGTLAYNLDATGKATEDEMLQALEITSPELAESFRRANGLNTVISNSLLSVGERQLICLARALLRKSKILVLDEATSSVDSKTDQTVQETIRRQFVDRGVTVITVAHRLDTVLSYDRIAVLGDGELLEYGAPSKLISIPGGELQKLVLADRLSKWKGSKKASRNAASNLVTV